MSTQKKEKNDFYDISNIVAMHAQYNILLSERSGGKSFQVKKYVIDNFMQKKEKFILLRRFVTELKEDYINGYFDDENMPYRKLTDNQYDGIMCYRGNLYFFVWENDVRVRKVVCGKYMSLASAGHYKSMALTQYTTVIYEEFVIRNKLAYRYLPNECDELQDFISTVARKNVISVFLIGNTINSLCPYFREWQLKHIPRQKPGTIDIYNMEYSSGTVKIAVEICEPRSNKGRMFFGKAEQTINNGVWTSEEYPKLQYEYKNCKVLYTIIWQWGEMCFKSELLKHEKDVIIYVRPCDINKIWDMDKYRFVSDKFLMCLDSCRYHTPRFYILNKADELFHSLMRIGRICFSDNLCGEEFNGIYKIYNEGR